jgi:HD-GYP domain-containing protein (c-di-GMP phosphodiesterase class II)
MTGYKHITPEQRLLKALARTVQASLLYPEGSERQTKNAQLFIDAFRELNKPFRLTLMGDEAIFEDQTLEAPSPIEILLVKTLNKAQWESILLEPGLTEEGLNELVTKLTAKTPPPLEGRGYDVGFLTLESARDHELPITNAAVGYMTLLGGAEEVVDNLGKGKQEGLEQARMVVSSLAGHLAAGTDIFKPVRNLKHYDEYTFTHALNVSILSMALGRALSIPDKVLETISLGAMCHDVGKERIPRDILHKPAALNPTEKEIMDRHPVEGARILLGMPGKVPALVPTIAYQHHMAVSSGGYPARLPNQKIHPASMLVAVADAYDAIRTIRPYRPPSTSEQAFTLLLIAARQGRVNKLFLGPLPKLTGVTATGKRVRLTNGTPAIILCENEKKPLMPYVRTEDGEGEEIDLETNTSIGIAGIL